MSFRSLREILPGTLQGLGIAERVRRERERGGPVSPQEAPGTAGPGEPAAPRRPGAARRATTDESEEQRGSDTGTGQRHRP